MNKKGFTLAELMGVIVILGILLLLIIPNVVKNIKNAKESLYNTQISSIKMALENWKDNNNNLLPNEGEIIYLTIGQLKKDNYLDNDIKDPKTGKMWPNDMLLSISNNNGYQYNVLTNTGTTTDVYLYQTPSITFDTGDVEILNTGDSYLEPIITLNKSDGTKEILINVTPTISGSGNSVSTTYGGVYQVRYDYLYGGIAISSVHNVIVRDEINNSDYTEILVPDTTLYADGTAIYFNPNTGTKCSLSEASLNLNSNTSTPTNIKNGCMKWYAFGDKENETEIRLILDHNSSALVRWDSNLGNSIEAGDITVALNTDIIGWKKSVRQTARMITADEVAHITGADIYLRWKSSLPYVANSNTPVIGENSWDFYFDGQQTFNPYWKDSYAVNDIKSDYSWLYDYTFGGTSGCRYPDDNKYLVNEEDENYIYGYWTSSPLNSNSVSMWVVSAYGKLLESNTASLYYGLRPVITIPKSLIK